MVGEGQSMQRFMSGIAVIMVATSLLAACRREDEPAVQPVSTAPGRPGPSAPQAGAACAVAPIDPRNPGSFEAMATKPVVSALAGSETLSAFAEALRRAGLDESLNKAKALTVFAPTNQALEGLARWRSASANVKSLERLLSNHVLPQRVSPQQLPGTFATLTGEELAVTTAKGVISVGMAAKVVCGNVQTKNATVYIIDAPVALG